jgi:phospholipid/cholesterol/gamma-HCH transport system substrate-binding protein
MMSMRKFSRIASRALALVMVALVLSSCGSWKGIANVPLPGGPGTGSNKTTIYVQMPDTLALNVNRRVRVADVFVGRVRAITLKNWVATLTLDLQPDVKLPQNTLAKIGQTSLLGSQHVQLDAPPDPSPQLLKNGDTIPLKNSSAFPTTERVLASIATILRGWRHLEPETIQTEIFNVPDRSGDQIRIPEQVGHLHRRAEQAARRHHPRHSTPPIGCCPSAQRTETLDRVLTEFPPLIKHFADTRDLFADAVTALAGSAWRPTTRWHRRARTCTPTCRICSGRSRSRSRASPYLVGALKLMLTLAVLDRECAEGGRGDYSSTCR